MFDFILEPALDEPELLDPDADVNESIESYLNKLLDSLVTLLAAMLFSMWALSASSWMLRPCFEFKLEFSLVNWLISS